MTPSIDEHRFDVLFNELIDRSRRLDGKQIARLQEVAEEALAGLPSADSGVIVFSLISEDLYGISNESHQIDVLIREMAFIASHVDMPRRESLRYLAMSLQADYATRLIQEELEETDDKG